MNILRLSKRMATLAACLGLAVFASGCLTAPVVPPPGILYTEYDAPLDFELGHDGVPTPVEGLKMGESQTRYLQLIHPALSFGWESAAIEDAAKNGGISKVEFADYHYFSVLSLYQEVTVRAYGK